MGVREVWEAGGQQMNEEQYAEVMGALRANDKEHESYNRRLHEHDLALKQITETQIQLVNLTNAVNNLAEGMDGLKTTVQRVEDRVVEMENRPVDRWRRIGFEVLKWAVIGALTFAAGCVYTRITKGV